MNNDYSYFSREEIEDYAAYCSHLSDRQFDKLLEVYELLKYRPNIGQHQAIVSVNRPLCVIATAGAGKTTMILVKIIVMHLVFGIDQSDISGVTFSANAKEMLMARYKKMSMAVGIEPLANFWTFHSFYLRILKALKKDIRIMSPEAKNTAMRTILRKIQGIVSTDAIRAFDTAMTYQANNLWTLNQMIDSGVLKQFKISITDYDTFFKDFTNHKVSLGLSDFTDLELEFHSLISSSETVRNALAGKFPYWVVDENQDTSKVQYDIINMLCANPSNKTVVGDIDQGIYGWRGADTRFMLEFAKDHKDAHMVTMDINYRVPVGILDVVAPMIKTNTGRFKMDMKSYNDGGEFIHTSYRDINSASIYVAHKILDLIGDKYIRHPEEIAVLNRKKEQAAIVTDILLENNIPVQIADPDSVFAKTFMVNQLIAIVRLALDPKNKKLFSAIIGRITQGVSGDNVKRMADCLDGMRPFDTCILSSPTFNDRLKFNINIVAETLNDIKDIVEKGEPLHKAFTLAYNMFKPYLTFTCNNTSMDFEEQTAYFSYLIRKCKVNNYTFSELEMAIDKSVALLNKYSSFAKAVKVMTYHGAKGLEFEVVFVFGLNSNSCPDTNKVMALPEDHKLGYIEEERRAAYVALTRGSKVTEILVDESQPSRFISELNLENATLRFVGDNGVLLESPPEVNEAESRVQRFDRDNSKGRKSLTELVQESGMVYSGGGAKGLTNVIIEGSGELFESESKDDDANTAQSEPEEIIVSDIRVTPAVTHEEIKERIAIKMEGEDVVL